MEIRDVVASLREQALEQRLRIESLQSQVSMLERFTWNLLMECRKSVVDGVLEIVWDPETNVLSTVDSPERTDDEPTLF